MPNLPRPNQIHERKIIYHLPRLKYQACTRSPISRTLIVLEREYEIHIHTTTKNFPIKQSPIELAWTKTTSYAFNSYIKYKMLEDTSIIYTHIKSLPSTKSRTHIANKSYPPRIQKTVQSCPGNNQGSPSTSPTKLPTQPTNNP